MNSGNEAKAEKADKNFLKHFLDIAEKGIYDVKKKTSVMARLENNINIIDIRHVNVDKTRRRGSMDTVNIGNEVFNCK